MNETALHDLLSGRRRDLGARLLRGGLAVAECLYALAMRGRNLSYDRRWLRQHRVPVPVISVGNITTGGTGKTPVAAWLANWLLAQGRHPALISRGYHSLGTTTDSTGRSTPIENDEKLVLDRLCPGVPHLQQRDRVASALRAIQDFGSDTLLLDDGFQHRRLARDLDLLLIDGLQPWGYDHLLPRGLLREQLSSLGRADLIIITRSDQCSAEQRDSLFRRIEQFRPNGACLEIAFKPRRLVDLNWQSHPLTEAAGKQILAFCGIGNPAGFRRTVTSLGAELDQLLTFPDHHHYVESDLSQIARRAKSTSIELVITTQKDLVKIAPDQWDGPPLMAVEIGVEFQSGEQLLTSRLRRLFDPQSSTNQ